MFPLSFGGYIVDTPGIRAFGLIHMEKTEISHYFPEIFKRASECKYYNCTHIHEPGCAVLEAVEKGEISESRYFSYVACSRRGTRNIGRETIDLNLAEYSELISFLIEKTYICKK